MTVERIMSANPLTVDENMPMYDAQTMMNDNGFHCLPVINKGKKLVGIVSDKDIMKAAPSSATTLSIYEMNGLLSKLKVKDIMSTDVKTADKNMKLADAATLMVDHDISWLPVMDGKNLVGIVSKTDLLKMLLETIGARIHGVSIDFIVNDKKGLLAELTSAISAQGLDVISLSVFDGNDNKTKTISIKVAGATEKQLMEIIQPFAIQVLD